MGLLRIEAPSEALVTLAEVKARLRIDDGADDVGLQRLIDAASRHAEQITQRAFISQRWAYVANGFPSGHKIHYQIEMQGYTQYASYITANVSGNDELVLPLPPLQSVESITYIDRNGATQTLSPADYIVDTSGLLGVITPAFGKVWPATQDRAQSLRVEFTCGYGAAADVEPNIVLAVLLLIAHFEQNREAVTDRTMTVLPHGVDNLLGPYVIPGAF